MTFELFGIFLLNITAIFFFMEMGITPWFCLENKLLRNKNYQQKTAFIIIPLWNNPRIPHQIIEWAVKGIRSCLVTRRTSWKYQLFHSLFNQTFLWPWTPELIFQVIMSQSFILFLHPHPSLIHLWMSKHLELVAQSELAPRQLKEGFTPSHCQERI